MTPPANAVVFEIPTFTYWLEGNTMCTVAKSTLRTIENSQPLVELLRDLTKNGEKICILSDTTLTRPLTADMQQYLNTEMAKYVKALAAFSSTKTGEAMVFVFSTLSNLPFPIQMCANEADARQWLKQHQTF